MVTAPIWVAAWKTPTCEVGRAVQRVIHQLNSHATRRDFPSTVSGTVVRGPQGGGRVPALRECKMRPQIFFDRFFRGAVSGHRSTRRLTPTIVPLEGRQLLSVSPTPGLTPTATMTQTATFPNLESLPNVASQAFLYFSSTIGTLTEVDITTSGSFTTQFSAENLGSSATTIEGTTSANLAINLPSGAIPVTIPSVTESFNAAPYDGITNDAGVSGKDFASVASSSATQTTALTSPAALAAFTGNFRIPITVSGHATGSASSGNGDLSDAFNTQTSVTVTITYDYIPNLPNLDPPTPVTSTTAPTSGGGTSSGSTPSTPNPTSTITSPTGNITGPVAPVTAPSQHTTSAPKKKPQVHVTVPPHHVVQHPLISRPKPKPLAHHPAVIKAKPSHKL
jgi:hypothetical protein